MTAVKKSELRRMIRSQQHDVAERSAESEAICRAVLGSSVYANARIICGYMPMAHEADIRPVLQQALADGKTLLLPRVTGAGTMSMCRVDDLRMLRKGAYGIPEPDERCYVEQPGADAMILVPLEAVTRSGLRLGKGGGYYDRLLCESKACTVGIAFTWQIVDDIPADPWDVRLQSVVCAEGMIRFDRSEKLL